MPPRRPDPRGRESVAAVLGALDSGAEPEAEGLRAAARYLLYLLASRHPGRVLEVRVHPDDLGKVIGRGGRTARALRTVIGSLAGGRYVRVDLLDVDEVR